MRVNSFLLSLRSLSLFLPREDEEEEEEEEEEG